jgi:hypothetical protein
MRIHNDLNSVLLEGMVVATDTSSENGVPLALVVKSYRKPGQEGEKPTWTKCRVDLGRCQSGCLSELAAGRTVRIVGHLCQIGRASLRILADHVELKPLGVG